MTPRFPRTRRFAAPWAMLGVDLFCTVLWLSAFATQAAYNTANLCGSRCNLSKAIVGLGVINTYVPPLIRRQTGTLSSLHTQTVSSLRPPPSSAATQ